VLTYADRRAVLIGEVGADPDLAPNATEVIVFPVGYRTWLDEGLPSHLPSRQTYPARPDESGRFTISTLAPGEYFVAAVPREQAGRQDADSFERLARVASRVTLTAGATVTVSLAPVRLR
jgi:hypothetical protein